MSPAEIREEIIDILSDIAPDENLDDLVDEKSFREQLELDSMDFGHRDGIAQATSSADP